MIATHLSKEETTSGYLGTTIMATFKNINLTDFLQKLNKANFYLIKNVSTRIGENTELNSTVGILMFHSITTLKSIGGSEKVILNTKLRNTATKDKIKTNLCNRR